MEGKILQEDLSWSGGLLKLLVNIFNITSEAAFIERSRRILETSLDL